MSHSYVIFVLSLITALTPFAIDTYLPALPAMALELGTTPVMMQASMGAYLLGIAFCPIVSGAFSDAVGRKPVIQVSLLLFVLFSVFCAMTDTAEVLVGLRLLQGAAGGTAMVVARTVLADLYRGDALSRANSHLLLFLSISPVIAPLAGGVLLQWGSWHLIFWVLAMLTLLPLALLLRFDETLPADKRRPFDLVDTARHYLHLVRQPMILTYLLITFGGSMFFFSMLSNGPFVYVEHFGLTPLAFGQLMAIISAIAFVSNALNARLVMTRGYRRMLRDSILMIIVVAVTLMIIVLAEFGGVWSVFIVYLSLMAGYHVISANAMAGVVDCAAERMGALSALMAFCRFLGGTIGSVAVGVLPFNPLLSFAVMLCVAASMLFACIYALGRMDRARTN